MLARSNPALAQAFASQEEMGVVFDGLTGGTSLEHQSNGSIIILNGTSSSGKTSILKALQELMEKPFLEAGIDKFIWMLPERYLERPLWDDVLGLAVQAGEVGNQLVFGMHRAVETLGRAGLNVLVDHVLVEDSWWRDVVIRFSSLPTYLVAVFCPLEVLEKRERARRNRTLGQARAQFERVHGLGIYDLVVDTSLLSPQDCALQIQARMLAGPPTALQELKHTLTGSKSQ